MVTRVLVLCLLGFTGLHAQTLAPPPLAPGQRIGWDMPGSRMESARTLTYAVFVDGVRFPFIPTDVNCTEPVPMSVMCAAHPPSAAYVAGTHTLEIAVTVLGVETKGAAWQVLAVTVVPPANGRVLP